MRRTMRVVAVLFVSCFLQLFRTSASLQQHNGNSVQNGYFYRNSQAEAIAMEAMLAEVLNEPPNGIVEYGLTEFTNRSNLGCRKTARKVDLPERLETLTDSKRPLPQHFDWRNYSVVSPVRDQGKCGRCWAWATVENIEGVRAVKTGNLTQLSVQQVVDCDYLDQGCQGGDSINAFSLIKKWGGLEAERDYKYEGITGKCRMNSSLAVVRIDGYVALSRNEQVIARYLMKHGPLAADINATRLFSYKRGIIMPDERWCSYKYINHEVLIVGFGTEQDVPYWIVKNSWGKKFGEDGYFRIKRGVNACGIEYNVVSVTMDSA